MNVTRRELLALVPAIAFVGCGSNETQKEIERLESLINEAETVDESAYPKVWLEALAIEIGDGREVLAADSPSWKDINIAANAIESTISVMVERPNTSSKAVPLPKVEDVLLDLERFLGGYYSFEASFSFVEQYEKGKSFDCEVLTSVREGTQSTSVNLEHFPLVLAQKYSRLSDTHLDIVGWLTNAGNKSLMFIVDTCKEL